VTKTCSLPTCTDKVLARGMCRMHYYRTLHHGSPSPAPRRRQRKGYDLAAHFISSGQWSVDVEAGQVVSARTGRTMGSLNSTGYVLLQAGKYTPLAHRVIWEAAHGPITDPLLEINHISGDKTDNRVDNLELVTRQQNMVHFHSQAQADQGRPSEPAVSFA